MKRKCLALLLSAAMAAGILSGCGGSQTSGGASADGASGGGEGGTAEIDFDEEPYEAVFMYWASNDPRDLASIEEAFNELTLEQLNMKVKLQPITIGTHAQQIQMILSSDDKLDIFPYWGSSEMSTYIESGFVVDISEYLDTVGQDIVEIVGREDLECCGLNGYMTGAPTMHERTNPITFIFRTDLFEETGISAEEIKSLDDVTAVFEKVKEQHPEIVVYGGASSMTFAQLSLQSMIDPLADGFGVLLNAGQETTVTNYFESEQFMNICKTAREWQEKGYTSADMATCTDTGEALMRAGNLFSYSCYGKPNTKQEKDDATGYDTTCIQVTQNACYTSTTNACCYAISSNSEDPEKAVMLLNWIFKTKEANDLINWGIEGVDYVVTEDGTIDYPEGTTQENVGYHQDFGWALPNQFNSYIWTGNDLDIWDQYQEARDSATVSKAYGFYFDNSAVVNEVSSLASVYSEYIVSLGTGIVDPEQVIPEFNEKLYASGLQTVMDEKQAQLDEWLAQQ